MNCTEIENIYYEVSTHVTGGTTIFWIIFSYVASLSLFGEDGIDTFVISKGNDWVMDFNTAQDKIETADAYSAITQSVSSGNLVLTDSDGDTLTLLGITSTLSEEYFV